jgi:nucleoid-associated protein YgaU
MTAVKVRLKLLALGVSVALVLLCPDPATLGRDLTAPRDRLAAVSVDRVVGQVVGAGLWLLALWVAVGLLAVSGAALPGACGRLSAGSAGVGVLLAPAAANAVPSPVWPSAPVTGSSTHVPAPVWPGKPTPPPTTPPPPAHDTTTSERVRAGDSLWLLAARRLGPTAGDRDIAEYWPQLYAANRAVIGPDPSLITPGQQLHEPAPTAQESTP